jgi:hypothetical protein
MISITNTSIRLGAVLIAFLPALPAAQAHHVVSDYGIASIEPTSVAEVGVEAAVFDHGDRSGNWQTISPAVEVAFANRFSVTARVPIARVRHDGGDEVYGLGDADVGVKLRLHATSHGELIVSAGLGVELPTGDDETGLGSGHVELTPFVAASTAMKLGDSNELVIFGLLSDRFSIASAHTHDGTTAGSVLAPHADHELFVRAAAAWVHGRHYVSAGIDGVAVLDAGVGAGPWLARFEAGRRIGDAFRLAAGIDVPFAGEERIDFSGRVAMAWMF